MTEGQQAGKLRFASLGSGSKGNATLVSDGETHLLVDCGFGLREAERRLADFGLHPRQLDAVLVTHEHGDHIRGVGPLARRHGVAVYLTPYLGHEWTGYADTAVEMKRLQRLAARMCEIPDGVEVQRQVAKIYEDRRKMQAGGMALNWGFAETLAYATLLDEGHPVRITGQDVGRGTFSDRHAVVHNQKDGTSYVPLQHMADGQPAFRTAREIYEANLPAETSRLAGLYRPVHHYDGFHIFAAGAADDDRMA